MNALFEHSPWVEARADARPSSGDRHADLMAVVHDATPEDNWAGRHFARVFGPNEALVQAYQAFYHPWHTGGAGVLEPRLKELVRLRIATLA